LTKLRNGENAVFPAQLLCRNSPALLTDVRKPTPTTRRTIDTSNLWTLSKFKSFWVKLL
jgi:hypothetical protein